ncbi:MAG: hypothetical protein WC866_04015 [Patescibacteria group bacterium]|jgi:hypothetical protein
MNERIEPVKSDRSTEHPSEVSGEIGMDATEKKAALRVQLQELGTKRESYQRSWREAFDAFKKQKEENDQERATMERLKLGNKLNLSEADLKSSDERMKENEEAAFRNAENYMKDLREIGDEVSKLHDELEELERNDSVN